MEIKIFAALLINIAAWLIGICLVSKIFRQRKEPMSEPIIVFNVLTCPEPGLEIRIVGKEALDFLGDVFASALLSNQCSDISRLHDILDGFEQARQTAEAMSYWFSPAGEAAERDLKRRKKS
jgi:hypothetical protein